MKTNQKGNERDPLRVMGKITPKKESEDQSFLSSQWAVYYDSVIRSMPTVSFLLELGLMSVLLFFLARNEWTGGRRRRRKCLLQILSFNKNRLLGKISLSPGIKGGITSF